MSPTKLPGSSCKEGNECHSLICLENQKCAGNEEGSACDQDKDCDVGLYCY